MFGAWENVLCILVLQLYPGFVVLLFIFTFNTFGKNYLNSKLQVVKDD